MTGYLTKADPDEEGETVDLTIPNEEISNIFEETVVIYTKRTDGSFVEWGRGNRIPADDRSSVSNHQLSRLS